MSGVWLRKLYRSFFPSLARQTRSDAWRFLLARCFESKNFYGVKPACRNDCRFGSRFRPPAKPRPTPGPVRRASRSLELIDCRPQCHML
jgi:hypothetical protein